MSKSILADTSFYRITYYNNNSNILFVVFNGLTGAINDPPFVFRYLTSRGHDIIACAQKEGTGYQGLSLKELKDAVSPHIAGKKVFLYGPSLGGYCALYYSGAVNGVPISFAPLHSDHPAMFKVKERRRPGVLPWRHSPLNEIQLTDKTPFVFFDPTRIIDKTFFDDVVAASFKKTNVYHFPYLGHSPEILKHLVLAGKLPDLIDNNR